MSGTGSVKPSAQAEVPAVVDLNLDLNLVLNPDRNQDPPQDPPEAFSTEAWVRCVVARATTVNPYLARRVWMARGQTLHVETARRALGKMNGTTNVKPQAEVPAVAVAGDRNQDLSLDRNQDLSLDLNLDPPGAFSTEVWVRCVVARATTAKWWPVPLAWTALGQTLFAQTARRATGKMNGTMHVKPQAEQQADRYPNSNLDRLRKASNPSERARCVAEKATIANVWPVPLVLMALGRTLSVQVARCVARKAMADGTTSAKTQLVAVVVKVCLYPNHNRNRNRNRNHNRNPNHNHNRNRNRNHNHNHNQKLQRLYLWLSLKRCDNQCP